MLNSGDYEGIEIIAQRFAPVIFENDRLHSVTFVILPLIRIYTEYCRKHFSIYYLFLTSSRNLTVPLKQLNTTTFDPSDLLLESVLPASVTQ